LNCLRSDFDFYLHAARQFELHEGIDGLRGGAVDVKDSLVSGKLELLSGFLVYKSGTVHGEDLGVCGKGDRSYQHHLVVLHAIDRLDDLLGRLVNQGVVE